MLNKAVAQDVRSNEEGLALVGMPYHEYGGNGIGIWISSGIVRIGLSRTTETKYQGVGLVEAELSPDDMQRAKDIHAQLCKAAVEKLTSDLTVDPEVFYSLRCMQDGKLEAHNGQLREFPKSVAFSAWDFQQSILDKYQSQGRSIVKFDVRVSDVRREKDKFVVAVKFVNSGRYPIKMATPDTWNRLFGQRLAIGGFRVGGDDEWRAELAGQPIVNKGDYPVDTVTVMGKSITSVTIAPGESVIYRFLAVPDGKVRRGEYKFSALVYSSIHVSGVNGAGGTVNFGSDGMSPPFTFDADFPSTPQEWKDYEERERGKRAEQGTKPGDKFAEAAHYRLVSDRGQRSRWVYTFIKGEIGVASYDEKGQPFLGKPVWKWVGDYSVPACCYPRAPCPRDGRWAGCTFGSRLNTPDEYVIHEERSFKAGEIMPPVIGYGGREFPSAHWKWLGA